MFLYKWLLSLIYYFFYIFVITTQLMRTRISCTCARPVRDTPVIYECAGPTAHRMFEQLLWRDIVGHVLEGLCETVCSQCSVMTGASCSTRCLCSVLPSQWIYLCRVMRHHMFGLIVCCVLVGRDLDTICWWWVRSPAGSFGSLWPPHLQNANLNPFLSLLLFPEICVPCMCKGGLRRPTHFKRERKSAPQPSHN